jgi:hypothetical protein
MAIWMSKMTLPVLFILVFIFAFLFGVCRSFFAQIIGYKIIEIIKIKYVKPWDYKKEMSKFKKGIVWVVRQFIW